MRIVLVGPPGAGKGTQARSLARRRGLTHVETGRVLREVAGRDDELGTAVRAALAAGVYVSDRLAVDIVQDSLSASGGTSYVLDGFPRTLEQALFFDGTSLSRGLVVIELVVDHGILSSRMAERVAADLAAGVIPRPDDVPEVFGERLRQYELRTRPVLAHYERSGRLAKVDGMADPESVSRAVDEVTASASP